MNVIPPLTITDARLTSSTAYETVPTAYNGATTYASGDAVSVAGTHGAYTVYKSLVGSNTGHTPASSPTYWQSFCTVYQAYSGGATYAAGDYVTDTTNHLIYESVVGANTGNALTDTTKWLLIGPSNKWAMFDFLRNTATVQASPLTIVITPGTRIDSIALMGMVADSVTITVTSGGVTKYTHTEDLGNREVLDWYDYFFEAFSTRPSLAVYDVPPYTDAVITITLTRSSGNVELGACVMGLYVYIGDVEHRSDDDALNFSTIERNFAGDATVVQRRSVPKNQLTLYAPKALATKIRNLRTSLNAVPAVWDGVADSSQGYFEMFLKLGIYRQFTLTPVDDTEVEISLQIEEF